MLYTICSSTTQLNYVSNRRKALAINGQLFGHVITSSHFFIRSYFILLLRSNFCFIEKLTDKSMNQVVS